MDELQEKLKEAERIRHETELRAMTLEQQVRSYNVTLVEMQDNYDS
jgi:hypothetical protein